MVTNYLQRMDVMYANHEGVESYAMAIPTYFTNSEGEEDFYMTDVDYGEQDLVYGETSPSVFFSGGQHLQFNYHPLLANSGIDVVSTANNHCLDRGVIGLNATIQALASAGVQQSGTRTNPQEAWHSIVNRNEWTIAHVACTDETNWLRNHRDREPDLVLNCYSPRYTNLIR